jgi:hypothetical protein
MRKNRRGNPRPQRGVWVADFKGLNDEMILVAIDSENRRVAERLVAFGANSLEISEELWDILDRHEPDRRRLIQAI